MSKKNYRGPISVIVTLFTEIWFGLVPISRRLCLSEFSASVPVSVVPVSCMKNAGVDGVGVFIELLLSIRETEAIFGLFEGSFWTQSNAIVRHFNAS